MEGLISDWPLPPAGASPASGDEADTSSVQCPFPAGAAAAADAGAEGAAARGVGAEGASTFTGFAAPSGSSDLPKMA
ncbi:MAG: hypothetical protein AAFV09_13350 [Pseudomonadota bacterium]